MDFFKNSLSKFADQNVHMYRIQFNEFDKSTHTLIEMSVSLGLQYALMSLSIQASRSLATTVSFYHIDLFGLYLNFM